MTTKPCLDHLLDDFEDPDALPRVIVNVVAGLASQVFDLELARIYDRSRTLGLRETAATQVRAGPCTAKVPEVMPGELNVHDSVIAESSASSPTKFDQKEIRGVRDAPHAL
jgi:hypothetical protein